MLIQYEKTKAMIRTQAIGHGTNVFFKDNKALQTGNIKDLRKRCMLLEKLIKKNHGESCHLLRMN